MIVLDSDICSYALLRRHAAAIGARLRSLDPRIIRIPAIVKAELYAGAYKSPNRAALLEKIDALLAPLMIVAFDDAMAADYAAIRSALERRGAVIGGNDLIVAATAVHLGAVLVTNNVREFERVDGLRVETWV